MTKISEHIDKLPTQSILAAVSGGLDSMVMLHLLSRSNHQVIVAHCNFQLRGDESDADEKLVIDHTRTYGMEVFTKKFNLSESHPGMGTQEAAREARYAWFETLANERGINVIATAHHLNDQAESILHHFVRGASVRGLIGMKVLSKRTRIFRPLLRISKDQLKSYASENNIAYREDSSNSSTKYTRNKLRHDIIPELEKLNPNFISTISRQSALYSEAATIIKEATAGFIDQHIQITQAEIRIPVEKLVHSGFPLHILEALTSEMDIKPHQLHAILALADSRTGAHIESKNWRATLDRKDIQLTLNNHEPFEPLTFHSLKELAGGPWQLARENSLPSSFDPKDGWFDEEKLQFPLTLRTWELGDRFTPLGMEGSQKISDFLVQQKASAHLKKQQLVLTLPDAIVWVIGRRIAHPYRVTPDTKTILKLTPDETILV